MSSPIGISNIALHAPYDASLDCCVGILGLHAARAVCRWGNASQRHIQVSPRHEQLSESLMLWHHIRELSHQRLILNTAPVHPDLHRPGSRPVRSCCFLQAEHRLRLREVHEVIVPW